jgi:glycosyltransferase involved in cell wall biosynthesis
MAKALCSNGKEHTIFLALNALLEETIGDIRREFKDIIPPSQICLWYPPLVDEYLTEDEKNNITQAVREAFFASLKPDTILIFALFLPCWNPQTATSVKKFDKNTPVFVLHHDLIPLLYPEKAHKEGNFQKILKDRLNDMEPCSKIFAVSQYSKDELLNNTSLDERKVEVLHNGYNPIFRRIHLSSGERKSFLAKFGIKKDYILYAGGEDERKNLHRLIEAFACLEQSLRSHCHLVFAGKMSEKAVKNLYKTAKIHGIAGTDLVMTGFVSVEDLAKLYNCCSLFVFPSLREGFGLPPLEAMACGAPVVVSNVSSLPEIVNMPAAFFDPFSVSSIRDKLAEVLTNANLRKELAEAGLKEAERFSWDKNALKFFEVAAQVSSGAHLPAFGDNSEIIKKLAEYAVNIKQNPLFPELTEALAISFAQNFPKRKQLLIDVSELVIQDMKGGIRRIERNILINLISMPNQNYEIVPVYFCYDAFYDARFWIKKFLDDTDKSIDYPPLIAYAGDILLVMELFTDSDSYISALQNLRSKGVAVKVIVYDILPLQLSNVYEDTFVQNFERWLSAVVGFDGAVCISKTVAAELADWVDKNAPDKKKLKIDVFHMGSDEENAKYSKDMPEDAVDILDKIAQKPSFILVSTIEPRKGHLQALKAFNILWEKGEDINLVFVGKQGWLADKIVKTIKKDKMSGERLFWLSDPKRKEGTSEKYLNEAYKASVCLIFPSTGEGFGLPIVEAARHGLPLILRDIPIFREVAGDNAYYFSGFEGEDLAHAVAEWLKLYKEGKHPKSDNIKRYTWKESAEELLNILINPK